MKRHLLASLCASFLPLVAARADVTTTYTLYLNPGTSLGNPVTNIMIFESAAGFAQPSIDFGGSANGYTLPGSGTVQLTHTSAFAPSTTFIIGLTQQVDKLSLVMFVNDTFANNAAGVRFNDSFYSITHNALISRLQSAEAGSQTDLNWFRDIFFPTDGSRAAFVIGSAPTAMEFTTGILIGRVPEQTSTFLLLILGDVALLALHRRLLCGRSA